MSDYKNLNPVGKKSFKRRLEFESSGISHIQDAVMKTLYEDEIDLVGEYHGVVLSVLGEPTTWLDTSKAAFLNAFDFDLDSQFYKIRVEPVHNMIPMPQSADDCLAINMHHTFSQPIESLNHKDLQVGDIVVVSFIDGSGVFNPKILKKTQRRDVSVANWSENVSPQKLSQIKADNAQITKPSGDGIGSGVKCKNNQIPKTFNKVDESQYSNDAVLKWLPIIRGVREDLESRFNIDLSGIRDETMLAIIDKESSGRPTVFNNIKHYGLTQQQDAYVFDAYEKYPGNQLISIPYPASNYGGKRKIHVEYLRGRIKDNEDIISNENLAGMWNIQTAFLYAYRYRSTHNWNQLYIANMHHEGGPTQKQVIEQFGELSPIDAIKKYADTKSEDKKNSIIEYVEDFSVKYNKYKQKLGEYNPEAATVIREDCEEKEENQEFVGPIQPSSNVMTLNEMIINHGIKHFRAPELLSKEERGGPKIIEPPQDFWPRILSTLELADEIRDILGTPLTVVSGYRTSAYNQLVHGKSMSEHVEFRALDLSWGGSNEELIRVATDVMERAASRGIRTGLGLYDTFVHIDTGSTKGVRRRWDDR